MLQWEGRSPSIRAITRALHNIRGRALLQPRWLGAAATWSIVVRVCSLGVGSGARTAMPKRWARGFASLLGVRGRIVDSWFVLVVSFGLNLGVIRGLAGLFRGLGTVASL